MLSFALALHAAPRAQAAVIERLEASVNSSIILLSDVTRFRATEKLRQQLDPLFGGTSVAAQGPNAPTSDVVNFLIDERLIAGQFPVTDAEVEQEINGIQSNNHIERAQLKKALTEQGFTFDEYFELIRISASKRNLIDRDIRTKVSISDDDVKNYFYNHYARSSEAPRAYHIEAVMVSNSSYKTPTAAHDAAARALKEIQSGEPFEEVAKRISDGPTAQNGGDLGTLTDDQMSPAIREQLKKLKIGQVSGIFGGGAAGAWYILKLLDVKTGESERFERMKEEIRNQLAASEYQHQISLWLERQRQTAFIHRAGEAATAGLPSAGT